MPNLMHKHEREALASQIANDIDAYCLQTYDDGDRNHLGASMIGKECERFLWYGFRWVLGPTFDGRMQRLFNRGHKEEARWIEWLRGIGAEVWEADPATGKQFRISGVDGHYGGSLDSIVRLPERYGVPDPMLGEFKTYGDKQYDKLLKEGLRKAKPEHFAQMSQYGKRYGLRYGLYCPINKNDDAIFPMIVELDWGLADEMERKAEHVITALEPPPRISENPAMLVCKFCPALGVCHNSAPYKRNCRSCANASPQADGKWACAVARDIIPENVIRIGCGQWTPAIRR